MQPCRIGLGHSPQTSQERGAAVAGAGRLGARRPGGVLKRPATGDWASFGALMASRGMGEPLSELGLTSLSMRALQKRAEEERLSEAAIDAALESGSPKETLTAALLKHLTQQPTTTAARISAALAGSKEQREGAYEELISLGRQAGTSQASPPVEDPGAIAQASVLPVIDAVLCADPSTVSQTEYQKACHVLGGLAQLAPQQVLGAWLCDLRYGFFTSGNYAAVCRKDPEALSRDDAMVVASATIMATAGFAQGIKSCLVPAGVDEQEWFVSWATADPLFPGGATTDAFRGRLLSLLVEILREPQGASDMMIGGVWWRVAILGSNPDLGLPLIEAGVIELAMSALESTSPSEWISKRSEPELPFAGVTMFFWTVSTLVFDGKTKLLIDKGVVDAVISMLKAYELAGTRKVDDANVGGMVCVYLLLASLDLSAAESRPIILQLEGIPTALRFMLDNPLFHFSGYCTPAQGSIVCALAFGKEEGKSFEFAQRDVDAVCHRCDPYCVFAACHHSSAVGPRATEVG
jgi:hypothetical protein